jgi:hypothetical protein
VDRSALSRRMLMTMLIPVVGVILLLAALAYLVSAST